MKKILIISFWLLCFTNSTKALAEAEYYVFCDNYQSAYTAATLEKKQGIIHVIDYPSNKVTSYQVARQYEPEIRRYIYIPSLVSTPDWLYQELDYFRNQVNSIHYYFDDQANRLIPTLIANSVWDFVSDTDRQNLLFEHVVNSSQFFANYTGRKLAFFNEAVKNIPVSIGLNSEDNSLVIVELIDFSNVGKPSWKMSEKSTDAVGNLAIKFGLGLDEPNTNAENIQVDLTYEEPTQKKAWEYINKWLKKIGQFPGVQTGKVTCSLATKHATEEANEEKEVKCSSLFPEPQWP